MSPSQGYIYISVSPVKDTLLFDTLIFTRFKNLKLAFLIKYYDQDFLMPTTRKQKKTKKSRGLEMLSDIKNLDIMSGGNHKRGK